MAGEAAELGVRAIQPEVRLGIVVEGPDTPVIGRVAVRALVAKVSLVHVIRPMTIQAFRRCVLEFLVDVTGLAGCRRVQASQGKRAQVMIESQLGLPGLYAMAVPAASTQRLLVCIVATMAADAARLEFLFLGRALVTGHTA